MPQPSILVVDDDESIGFMIKMMLEHKGFSVIVKQDALQLKELIQSSNIGLIILDMLINGIKGTDICTQLKADAETNHIPVMMMTALPDIEQICKDAGADDFIAKPFEMDVFISKVKGFIS